MTATLGFFTQNELDCVVGYSRRRQRLVESKVLPRGERVKTFGQETIIFPEFAAAGLVAERPSAQDEPLLARLASTTEGLYVAPSFLAMAEVLRSALRGRKGWRLDDLVAVLLEGASDELAAWRMQVLEAERELAEVGIRLSLDVGRIEDVTDTGYHIALADSGRIITVALNAARASLPTGIWVTRDLVEFGARRGELLIPTVAPDLLALVHETPATGDAEEADFEEMFREVDFQPVVVPLVSDAPTERESGELTARCTPTPTRWSAVTAPPRRGDLRVRAPRRALVRRHLPGRVSL
jgi:hypothetical protein